MIPGPELSYDHLYDFFLPLPIKTLLSLKQVNKLYNRVVQDVIFTRTEQSAIEAQDRIVDYWLQNSTELTKNTNSGSFAYELQQNIAKSLNKNKFNLKQLTQRLLLQVALVDPNFVIESKIIKQLIEKLARTNDMAESNHALEVLSLLVPRISYRDTLQLNAVIMSKLRQKSFKPQECNYKFKESKFAWSCLIQIAGRLNSNDAIHLFDELVDFQIFESANISETFPVLSCCVKRIDRDKIPERIAKYIGLTAGYLFLANYLLKDSMRIMIPLLENASNVEQLLKYFRELSKESERYNKVLSLRCIKSLLSKMDCSALNQSELESLAAEMIEKLDDSDVSFTIWSILPHLSSVKTVQNKADQLCRKMISLAYSKAIPNSEINEIIRCLSSLLPYVDEEYRNSHILAISEGLIKETESAKLVLGAFTNLASFINKDAFQTLLKRVEISCHKLEGFAKDRFSESFSQFLVSLLKKNSNNEIKELIINLLEKNSILEKLSEDTPFHRPTLICTGLVLNCMKQLLLNVGLEEKKDVNADEGLIFTVKKSINAEDTKTIDFIIDKLHTILTPSLQHLLTEIEKKLAFELLTHVVDYLQPNENTLITVIMNFSIGENNAKFLLRSGALIGNKIGSVDNCSATLTTATSRGLSAASLDPEDKPQDVRLSVNCQQTLTIEHWLNEEYVSRDVIVYIRWWLSTGGKLNEDQLARLLGNLVKELSFDSKRQAAYQCILQVANEVPKETINSLERQLGEEGAKKQSAILFLVALYEKTRISTSKLIAILLHYSKDKLIRREILQALIKINAKISESDFAMLVVLANKLLEEPAPYEILHYLPHLVEQHGDKDLLILPLLKLVEKQDEAIGRQALSALAKIANSGSQKKILEEINTIKANAVNKPSALFEHFALNLNAKFRTEQFTEHLKLFSRSENDNKQKEIINGSNGQGQSSNTVPVDIFPYLKDHLKMNCPFSDEYCKALLENHSFYQCLLSSDSDFFSYNSYQEDLQKLALMHHLLPVANEVQRKEMTKWIVVRLRDGFFYCTREKALELILNLPLGEYKIADSPDATAAALIVQVLQDLDNMAKKEQPQQPGKNENTQHCILQNWVNLANQFLAKIIEFGEFWLLNPLCDHLKNIQAMMCGYKPINTTNTSQSFFVQVQESSSSANLSSSPNLA